MCAGMGEDHSRIELGALSWAEELQPQSQRRDRLWRLKVPESGPFLTVVTMPCYVSACLRRTETARWRVFLSGGGTAGVSLHMLTMFLKVHTQTHPLGISAPPQLCQGQAGPVQAKAQETRLVGVTGSGPWGWCGSRKDGAWHQQWRHGHPLLGKLGLPAWA